MTSEHVRFWRCSLQNASITPIFGWTESEQVHGHLYPGKDSDLVTKKLKSLGLHRHASLNLHDYLYRKYASSFVLVYESDVDRYSGLGCIALQIRKFPTFGIYIESTYVVKIARFCWYIALFILEPRKRKEYVPPKRRLIY
jgi:hypothetical protein